MRKIAKIGLGVALACGAAVAVAAPAAAQVSFGIGVGPAYGYAPPPPVVPAYSCYDAYGNYSTPIRTVPPTRRQFTVMAARWLRHISVSALASAAMAGVATATLIAATISTEDFAVATAVAWSRTAGSATEVVVITAADRPA